MSRSRLASSLCCGAAAASLLPASLTFSAAEVDGEVKLEPGDKVFYVMPPSSIPKYTPKPWPEGLDVKLDPHDLIFYLLYDVIF